MHIGDVGRGLDFKSLKHEARFFPGFVEFDHKHADTQVFHIDLFTMLAVEFRTLTLVLGRRASPPGFRRLFFRLEKLFK